jgi:hypothetical protein
VIYFHVGREGAGGPTMETKQGDRVKSVLNGEDYTIKRIVNGMVVLESSNGKKQIMTGVDSLKIFYEKKEEARL